MTFKELRALSGMTQKAFSEYFGIPRRTVEDWETGKRKCTDYLLSLMQYKLENEGIITEMDKILVKAHKEAALLEMKQKLKAHEEWKKKHPRTNNTIKGTAD